MSILISGNSKLGKNIAQFGMDRSTCKDKTENCSKYCYANRGNFLFDKVQASLRANTELSRETEFDTAVLQEIKMHNRKCKIKNKTGDIIRWVRIHPSGDFYNQDYANKWFKVARSLPEVTFMAFTKASKIDFKNKPSNLVIYQSIDPTTKKFNATLVGHKLAFVSKIGKNVKHMSKITLDVPGHGKQTFRVCNSKCSVCKYCYLDKGNVVFHQR